MSIFFLISFISHRTHFACAASNAGDGDTGGDVATGLAILPENSRNLVDPSKLSSHFDTLRVYSKPSKCAQTRQHLF
jgi:hypothetical protein